MKSISYIHFWVFVSLIFVLMAVGSDSADRERVVVVELFTSHGCSSCPPADYVLGQLLKTDFAGIKVIPLSLHVDYWNQSWQDPFSSYKWTERQKRYCRQLSPDWIYTPQTVINGSRECIGSVEVKVHQAIKKAAEPLNAVDVDIVKQEFDASQMKIQVSAHIKSISRRAPRKCVPVFILFENGLVTNVPRGENAGITIHNERVVRRMMPGKPFELSHPVDRQATQTLSLDREWDREKMGVVVLVQDMQNMTILGAGESVMKVDKKRVGK